MLRQAAQSAAKEREDFPRVPLRKQIDHRTVSAFHQRHFEVVHKTCGHPPEVVANHDDDLDALAVGLTQSRDQFCIL